MTVPGELAPPAPPATPAVPATPTKDVVVVPPVTEDVLSGLTISDEARKQLQGNKELLGIVAQNLQTKRDANAEAKAMREQLDALGLEQKKKEDEELKQKGEFEKLYKKSQKDVEERDAKLNQMAIKNKLSILAAQKGLRKAEYLRLFDTSDLVIDNAGEIAGLDQKFEKFFSDNPELFNGSGATVPSTESGRPQISTTVNPSDRYAELQQKARGGNVRAITMLRMFKKENNL